MKEGEVVGGEKMNVNHQYCVVEKWPIVVCESRSSCKDENKPVVLRKFLLGFRVLHSIAYCWENQEEEGETVAQEIVQLQEF